MSNPLHDQVFASLEDLRAAVKLLPDVERANPLIKALDLGLAVCAGIAGERLAPALVHQFAWRLCDLLAEGGAEVSIGLVLPQPPRLICA